MSSPVINPRFVNLSDKVDPEVANAIRLLYAGLKDHSDAFTALTAKLAASGVATISPATASASSSSSSTGSSGSPGGGGSTPKKTLTLAQIADDPDSGRFAVSAFDASQSIAGARLRLVSSTHLNLQASLVAAGVVAAFSYSSTTSSITISWIAFTIPRPDQTSIAVSSGSAPAFTGLSSSSTYHFGIYVDNAGNVNVVMSDNTTSKGSINWQVQTIGADGHNVVSTDFTASTPASGSGGGSGGGQGGTCPADDEPMETKELGVCSAVEIIAGMHVRGGDGTWHEVAEAYSVSGWLQYVLIHNDGWHHVDVDHRWLRPGGDFRADLNSLRDWAIQHELLVGHYVKGSDDELYRVLAVSPQHQGSYRKIRVYPGSNGDRSMRMGQLVTHNYNTV